MCNSIQVVVCLILANVFVGCHTILVAEDGRRVENISLRAMSHNTRSPEIGKTYIHRGGRSMKVIQVLNGGVLVQPVVGDMEFHFRCSVVFDEKMTIYIETRQMYADDEYLRKGLFEYVGHHTYVTVNDRVATVRKFREVPTIDK